MTRNIASTYPLLGRTKNCTPRDACKSVRFRGSVGLSEESPGADDWKVPVFCETRIDDMILVLPVSERRGVL